MAFIEGGPHSNVHLWFGYEMKSMNSPEEPIFFLHHGNIERLNTLFQDCWDYEFVAPSAMTSVHYPSLGNNPNPIPTYVTSASYKRDIYNNIGNVSIDNPMSYNWKSYMIGSSTTYTNVAAPWMPFGNWPSPRGDYFVGYPAAPTKGWDNMMYTYGNDNLVNTLGSCCTKNTQWTYFPAPGSTITKKRDASKKFEITEESDVTEPSPNITSSSSNENFVYTSLTLAMSELKKKGLCTTDALEVLAMQECQQSAKQQFPPDMADWMKMNGLVPEQFERICDSVDSSYFSEAGVVFAVVQDDDDSSSHTNANVWATVGYSIAGVVVLAALIAGIVIFARRKENKGDSVDYLNM